MQAAQLQHDEEQEEDDRAARVQQVLPLLPEAHGTQRVEVMRIAGCGLGILIRRPHSPIRNCEGQ
jgi:hypothetical protein